MKADVVSAGIAAIQAAETQALTDQLGIAYDAGATDQKAADGTAGAFTQADIDAAVAAANAQAATALAAVQASLDAMTSKEAGEEQTVAQVQAALVAVQSALDAVKAVLVPPAPAAS